MLRMIEEATHAGYPMDAAAVLLIELEGLRETVKEQVEQIHEVCVSCRAREFRVANRSLSSRWPVPLPQPELRASLSKCTMRRSAPFPTALMPCG